jgi:predicted metal-dependent HD superfamily phosphohydrolase
MAGSYPKLQPLICLPIRFSVPVETVLKQRPKPTKNLPLGYVAAGQIDLGRSRAALAVNLIGLASLFAFGWLFVQLGRAIRPEVMSGNNFILLSQANILALLLTLIATLLLHELIHGLGFWLLSKSRPKFGVHLLYAYAAAPDWYLPRDPFMIVGLAPFLIITLLGLSALLLVSANGVPVLLAAITLNAAGSMGDLTVAGWLLTRSPDLLAQDSGPAVRIFEPQPDLLTRMRARWAELMAALEVDPALTQAIFDDLVGHYLEPHRHYHNLEHVAYVMDVVTRLKPLAKDYQALQLAIWFHDVIYNPKASENEARSAEYAGRQLSRLGLEQEMIAEVQRLIMVTVDHQAAEDDIDAQILIDADLAPLAAEEATFEQQSQAIRREFDHVPDDLYRTGRLQVLSAFLSRDRIFYTEALYADLEEQARHNLARGIQELSASSVPKAG